MAYSTIANIRRRLSGGVATTHNNYLPTTEVSDEFLGEMQTEASNIIDSHLEPIFPSNFPFASGDEPALITNIATGLGATLARSYINPSENTYKKEYQAEYERYIELLQKIARLEIELPEVAVPFTDALFTRDHTPVFDLDDTLSQAVDSDLIDEIDSERG